MEITAVISATDEAALREGIAPNRAMAFKRLTFDMEVPFVVVLLCGERVLFQVADERVRGVTVETIAEFFLLLDEAVADDGSAQGKVFFDSHYHAIHITPRLVGLDFAVGSCDIAFVEDWCRSWD